MSESQRSYWEICSLLGGMWGFFTCHASAAGQLGHSSHRFSLTFSIKHPFQWSRLFHCDLCRSSACPPITPVFSILRGSKQILGNKHKEETVELVGGWCYSTSSPVHLQVRPHAGLEGGSVQDDGSCLFYSFSKAFVFLKFENCLGVAQMQMWWIKLPRMKSSSPKIRGKFAINSSSTLSLLSSLPDSPGEVLENVDHVVKWS